MDGRTYSIPVCNYGPLQKRIEKANDRADRLGMPHIELRIVSETTKERRNALGCVFEQRYYEIEVTGDVPKLEGWEIIASLRPVDSTDRASEVIVQEVPGRQCPPEYRTADVRWCDHCKRRTRRRVVYVMRDELGSCAQVGTTCVGEFLGNVSPEVFLKKAELIFNVDDLVREATKEDWSEKQAPVRVGPDIDEFVAVCALVIRKLGWVPKSKADENHIPTAKIAWEFCQSPESPYWVNFSQEHQLVAEPQDGELAHNALAWARALGTNEPSTYLYNLGATCRQEIVELQNAGYVASVIEAYKRRQAEPQPEEKEHKHVGNVGQREVFQGLRVTKVKGYDTDYGVKHLVTFEDRDGNLLEWWASPGVDISWAVVDDTVNVRATVKEHKEFKSTPWTVVERVVLEAENTKPPKKKKAAKPPEPESHTTSDDEVPF